MHFATVKRTLRRALARPREEGRVSYQTPLTIVDAVRRVTKREFVLPDIQREFVWDAKQISELFDSLMRGYPIGTFLFWTVEESETGRQNLYAFLSDYDERSPHNELFEPAAGRSVIAVLDGQQRLTALSIGLTGTYTVKVPRRRRDDPAAYPARRLFLNILAVDEDAAPDSSMYDFQLLTEEEAKERKEFTFWVPVSAVLDFDPDEDDHETYLEQFGLDNDRHARRTLRRLTKLVHETPIVSAYYERENDLDKVLNIFIRVNRGGSKLSYSDLLMSMATRHWTDRDAREEVHDLVDEINAIGEGFDISRDRVIKAAFVLADRPDIKLKADNMLGNMLAVEKHWDAIRSSLLTTMQLLADFGFSSISLRAHNSLIPIAYYVHDRGLDSTYLDGGASHADRALVRSWLTRSLLRSGYWTGAVDPLLLAARAVIGSTDGGFPSEQIEDAIATATRKSLAFTEGDVEDLLLCSYGRPLTIPLLTLVLDQAIARGAFHIDHVYPKSKLTKRSLTRALATAGRPAEELDLWRSRADRLPNLQLLRSKENVAKADQVPSAWAEGLAKPVRDVITIGNDLGELPSEPAAWFDWYEARERRLRDALSIAVGATPTG